MPKEKCSTGVRLRCFVKEFGEEYFTTDGKVLFCKLCDVKVTAEKRFHVQQHVKTLKHIGHMARKKSSQEKQQLIFNDRTASSRSDKTSEFSKELCKMMISANIPLAKVDNLHFKKFMEKHTNRTIPTESTLRKTYLSLCYDETIQKIRSSVADNKIWVSIDETTDIEGRYIANVIVGTLHSDRPGEIFLLTTEVLERTNSSSIAIVFDNAMKLLWGDNLKRENVLLFVTDAAPYMVKAAKGLKMFYPNMIHVTCIAHAMHRVAEEIQQNYPDVDKLISNMKKIFIKAPLRVEVFKTKTPSIALPPQPITTRGGTWLQAAIYYYDNYTIIKDIVTILNSDDASSIKIAQDLFSDKLLGNLAYIKSNYSCLISAIANLESAGMNIHEALKIVDNVEQQIEQAQGQVGEKVKNKLKTVLGRNDGYATLRKIADVLCGNVEVECGNMMLDSSDITLFKYAPITSCDIERSFSAYKTLLSDNRRSFSFENLKKHIVIQYNVTKAGD